MNGRSTAPDAARGTQRGGWAEVGTAPLKWLLRERVRLAQRVLEQTEMPVQRVAERASFNSTTALRRQFIEDRGNDSGEIPDDLSRRAGSGL